VRISSDIRVASLSLDRGGDQFLVRDAAAYNSRYKAIKTFERVPLDVTVVQAPSKFVHVTFDVLLACVVVNAVKSALHNRPNGFDTVRRNAVAGVFVLYVVYRSVLEVLFHQILISAQLVGVNGRALLNVLLNRVVEADFSSALDRGCFSPSATFTHSDNSSLANWPDTQVMTLVKMAIRFLAADVHLVHFDDALEQFGVISTGFAETLKNKPSGFLSNADLFRQLHRTDSFAGSHKQVHSVNPLVKWDMRAFKDRPCPNSEVQTASVTAVIAALPSGNAIFCLTGGTDRAIGPQTRFKVLSSGFSVGIQVEELKSTYRGAAH
jgi:hypothetical protein